MPRFLSVTCLLLFLSSCASDDPERMEGTEPGDCTDDADNDADGLFDCDDPGCAGAAACEEADTDTDTDTDTDMGCATPPPGSLLLAGNGVTVCCPNADLDDSGEVNGTTYTRRDGRGCVLLHQALAIMRQHAQLALRI